MSVLEAGASPHPSVPGTTARRLSARRRPGRARTRRGYPRKRRLGRERHCYASACHVASRTELSTGSVYHRRSAWLRDRTAEQRQQGTEPTRNSSRCREPSPIANSVPSVAPPTGLVRNRTHPFRAPGSDANRRPIVRKGVSTPPFVSGIPTVVRSLIRVSVPERFRSRLAIMTRLLGFYLAS
jgi:hypothetical protein